MPVRLAPSRSREADDSVLVKTERARDVSRAVAQTFPTKHTKSAKTFFRTNQRVSWVRESRPRIQCHARADLTFDLPFGQTTGANPSFRFSVRTLRATRPNARCARATNASCLSATVLFRSFLISQSNVELNLHHRSQKSPSVLQAIRDYPRWPIALRAADNHRSDESGYARTDGEYPEREHCGRPVGLGDAHARSPVRRWRARDNAVPTGSRGKAHARMCECKSSR